MRRPFAIALGVLVLLVCTPRLDAQPADELELHFIDVGQGDCTLIKCPGGYTILIDCGSSSGADGNDARDYVLQQHRDHDPAHRCRDHHPPGPRSLQTLRSALRGIQVGHVYTTGPASEHQDENIDQWLRGFQPARFTELTDHDFNPRTTPHASIPAGDANLFILAADETGVRTADNFIVNVRSVVVGAASAAWARVVKISYGDFDAILTGDATIDTEDAIIDRYADWWLGSELLKIGHHGSSTTSTFPRWARVVKPKIAVASASGNSYGHPRRSVLQRLEPYTLPAPAHRLWWGWWQGSAQYETKTNYSEQIYVTASSGTVGVSADGHGSDFTVQTAH